MALIEWDENMTVGVEELDEQHKELIRLINYSYEAIQKHDEKMISSLIDEMKAYANLHFKTEEGYLKKYRYPEIDQHKFAHSKFNLEVEDFQKKRFEKTNFSQIFVFLSRWLVSHIMDEDKKYIKYLQDDTQNN